MKKVGIPRAMLYYKYFPMWKSFLLELGAEVIVSEHSNQQTLTKGSSRLISDTCLPIKFYIGHVISLTDKCDYILIPVVRAMEKKGLNCARILGLPDLTRAVVPEAPPILEMEFDINRGRRYLYQQVYNLGRHFSRDPLKIRSAALRAWEVQSTYRDVMIEGQLTFNETVELLGNCLSVNSKVSSSNKNGSIKIGMIGHPYILQDTQMNHRLLERLQQYNVEILTPEMLPPEQLSKSVTGIVSSKYWASDNDVLGAVGQYIENKLDGIISVTAFGCGPDSLMMYLAQEKAHNNGIPYMGLTLEEHTAEAGVLTRLEAFLDMIHQYKKGNV